MDVADEPTWTYLRRVPRTAGHLLPPRMHPHQACPANSSPPASPTKVSAPATMLFLCGRAGRAVGLPIGYLTGGKIGRNSCKARVGQYVVLSVGAETLQKKQ